MKKFALIICALSIFAVSFGQKSGEAKIDKGKLQFNAGVGLSTWGIPVYVGVDYWVTPDITVGLEASLRYRILHSYGYVGGSINANYHFNKILDLPDNLDLYAGISAGPYVYIGGSAYGYFGFSGQVGGRYKINDKMWLNAELGGGTFSGAKIGITLRR
jgi:outer membrane immunogenic protein